MEKGYHQTVQTLGVFILFSFSFFFILWKEKIQNSYAICIVVEQNH